MSLPDDKSGSGASTKSAVHFGIPHDVNESQDTGVVIPAPSPSLMDLHTAISTILPGLERFMRFESPDEIAARRGEWTDIFDEPLPAVGVGADAVLMTLRDVVIPNGLRVGNPVFSGWMSIMPSAVPAATALAATIAGPQRWWVQTFNTLEHVAQRWLAHLLGLSPSHQGLFTSGGAVANLVALTAARQHAAEQLGIDAADVGIAAIPHPRFYATSETHHVVRRAVSVLGFGKQAVVTISTDEQLRMDVAALRARLQRDRNDGCTPIAILATAGTTNSGAIDPLPELAALCREESIWLHVDGAYGLLGTLDPTVAPLYGDLAAADSLVLDPHKWLNAPLGSGAVFVRDRALLRRTFALGTAAYLDDEHAEDGGAPLGSQFADYGYEFHEIGVELSAPPRGVHVWAILKELGADGVRARVRRNIALAHYLAELVNRSPVLELTVPVTLSICCFRYVPPGLPVSQDADSLTLLNHINRDVLYRIQSRGRSIPSGTTVHDKFVIRPCYLNPRTTEADIEALVEEAERCGAEAWEAHLATS
jgi:aromatic-L-amino-acid/L-tryptophan decarboxylase